MASKLQDQSTLIDDLFEAWAKFLLHFFGRFDDPSCNLGQGLFLTDIPFGHRYLLQTLRTAEHAESQRYQRSSAASAIPTYGQQRPTSWIATRLWSLGPRFSLLHLHKLECKVLNVLAILQLFSPSLRDGFNAQIGP